ncbi:MAG: MBL fold metallo-hydrolase [Spirochaetaceae bacterium]|nr:MAG: MBL fold metallo-hydrolase [Spirochaetaceae bacterium]
MTPQVITIDCDYIQPQLAAAYLLIHRGRAVFIENNTQYAVPLMIDILRENGLEPDDVDYAIVTHVHLDHAGGSSALMDACPNAVMLCHPRAVRHLVDPARLIAGTREVYGAERFERLYGTIGPVSEDRVRSVADDEVIDWNGRNLRFLHTPGHASHHISVVDTDSNSVFTGDVFGVCYPALQQNGILAFVSTPPTDFDVEQSRDSINRIAALGMKNIFPTHFGRMDDPHGALIQLHQGLDFSEELMEETYLSLKQGDDPEMVNRNCFKRLMAYTKGCFAGLKIEMSQSNWDLLALDIELSANGLFFAAQRKLRNK